jgi:hypothetical protein
MQNSLIIASSLISVSASAPYIVEVLRGKTKPRVVSWLTWTMLTAIAGAASLADHQYPAAILSFCSAFSTGLIVVLGLRYGDRKFTSLDIVCQAAALAGLALWLLLDSPVAAVLTMVTIDLVGCVPTIVHSWHKPYEETWIAFAMSSLAAALTLAAVNSGWQVTAVAYPIYLVLANIILAAVIIVRLKYAKPGVPAELRQL